LTRETLGNRELARKPRAMYCMNVQLREISMHRPYTVALHDSRALPAPERIAAEVRFISALERTLGDPDEVVTTYKAWITANESQANEVDRTTAALAVRWPVAYQVATQAGLSGVHGTEEIAFDIRLAR
jgi:hypothetical protein